MILVVMGVAGSGKTTIGSRLAVSLGYPYLDGDSLHPPANIEKMSRGIPLTDEDREPWLRAIRARLLDAFFSGASLVVGCSALKHSYRAVIENGVPVVWIYLKGGEEIIRARVRARPGHFFDPDLLASQFEALEEPSDAIVVDISQSPREIVERILTELRTVPEIEVFADEVELASGAAEAAVQVIVGAVRRSGRCSVALSGGESPQPFHRLLASRYRDRIPWSDVHFFWGDERYVPHDDGRSNYRMARETLLDHVPCPAANIHPMPTGFPDPDAAARAYETTLKEFFPGDWPRFDLTIMGIGPDGHTASLFPGNPALAERERWVLAVTARAEPPTRLTLTLPALNQAVHTYFLVSGSSKAAAVRHVLSGRTETEAHPAAGIRPIAGGLIWWLDREAAGRNLYTLDSS